VTAGDGTTFPSPGIDGVRGRRRALTVFSATSLAILVVDLVTKQLVVAHLEGRQPVRLLDGAVYLVAIRNSGAAWSIGRSFTVIFPILAIGAVCWIGWMTLRLRSVPWAVALGLVLGGVCGNLTDRLFRAPGPFQGHVVDFVSVFDDGGRVFPVFNAADSALSIGLCLILVLELTGRHRDGTRIRKQA
jgi:signal peptidase II